MGRKEIAIGGIIGLVVLLAAACTFQFPYDYIEDRAEYRITFKVTPDDAEVILNGRFIGLAYEFTGGDAVLVLSSRDSELLLRKRGYEEEEIDLWEYSGRTIAIERKLTPVEKYGEGKVAEETKPVAETDPAKTEPERPDSEPPPTPEQPKRIVQVSMTVQPADAAIYLDGKFLGVAPASGQITNLKLKPGRYQFQILKPGYRTLEQTQVIPDQEKLELTFQLEKGK